MRGEFNERNEMMKFDPEQNRIPTGFLTEDELAALRAANHGWVRYIFGDWVDTPTPIFSEGVIYRAKPATTIIVNGIEVPEPVREALRLDQTYWVANLPSANLAWTVSWSNDAYDSRVLNCGLIHLTEAAAVAHAKAMLVRRRCGGDV